MTDIRDSIGQLAKDFDLTETAVRLRVSQAEDAGTGSGPTTVNRASRWDPKTSVR